MKAQTLATLAQLKDAEWFSRLGIKDVKTAIVLDSWKDALDPKRFRNWESLCLEARNRYTELLMTKNKSRFNRWNEALSEVTSVVVPLVKQKSEAVMRLNALPRKFEDTVRWDIMHLCMEAEYADVYPPGFYSALGF